MAKKLTAADGGSADDDTPDRKHNMAARAVTVRDVCRDIANLEAERKKVSEQIREVKQIKIKGELGMKIGDFNAAMRLYNLEGDDRNEFFDTLRETFSALGEGDQLDWLKAAAE